MFCLEHMDKHLQKTVEDDVSEHRRLKDALLETPNGRELYNKEL